MNDTTGEWWTGTGPEDIDEYLQSQTGPVDGQTATATGGWFSVRCILRFPGDARSTYEERVTLWRAEDIGHAVALAEADVEEYGASVGGTYMGLAQAYALTDEPVHGAEVFSLMRDSSLGPDAYLDAFFDTGNERQGVIADEESRKPV